MPPASPSALAIAQAVAAAPGLRLGGLHVYHGGIQHVRTTDDRRAAVANGPAAAARATAAQLRAAGLEVPVVTGAGTGISPLELEPGWPLTKAKLPTSASPSVQALPRSYSLLRYLTRHLYI